MGISDLERMDSISSSNKEAESASAHALSLEAFSVDDFDKARSNGSKSKTEEGVSQAETNPVELRVYKSHNYKFAGTDGFQQGVPEFLQSGTANDGGKVRYDKAGNIIEWKSAEGALERKYIYADVASQLAKFTFNPAKPYLGTEEVGEVTQQNPITGVMADTPWNAIHDHKELDQRLLEVRETGNKIWLRNDTGLFEEFETDDKGAKHSLYVFAQDKELLPQTIKSPLENRLYATEQNPEKSISAKSIQQGNLGDCAFEAALAALAENHKNAILEMITDNKDGTYTVKFPRSVDVRVEAPTEAELETFNGPSGINFVGKMYSGEGEIVSQKPQGPEDGYWATVIEKAHRYLGGAADKNTGALPIDAIRLLTGKDNFEEIIPATEKNAIMRSNLGLDPNASWFSVGTGGIHSFGSLDEHLESALAEGKLVVAGTPNEGELWLRSDGDKDSEPRGHLLPSHAYSVLRYIPPNGADEAKVVLRDPWGRTMNLQNKNGYLQVSMSDFAKLFDGVYIGG